MTITVILSARQRHGPAAAEHRSAVFWLVLVALALFLPDLFWPPADEIADRPALRASFRSKCLETHDFVRFDSKTRPVTKSRSAFIGCRQALSPPPRLSVFLTPDGPSGSIAYRHSPARSPEFF